MDIKTEANAFRLIKQLLDRDQIVEPILPMKPQKTAFPAQANPHPLPRCAPEEQGVESSLIQRYIEALTQDEETFTHTLTIVRHGKVIAQTAMFPYRTDVWHITHSLCKSVTGLAVGLLYDDGLISLDDKLSKFFGKGGMLPTGRARGVTVRQLLTMSSGVLFNEAGTVTETDWVKCFLESLLRFEPGTEFAYNSMNSYMLAAIVRNVTGKSVRALLDERLFSKMGIVEYDWETCPMGTEKGGMGMYLLPEDMAKLGMLYLQKGLWNGERLLSEEWTTMATTAQIVVPDHIGVYDYGFQVWVRKEHNYFALNGMFGQNVLVFPDNDLLVVVTAGNNDMFQQNHYFEITERFFGQPLGDKPIFGGWGARRKLHRCETLLASPPVPARRGVWHRLARADNDAAMVERLNGSVFDFDEAEGKSVGLLPLIVQAVQNNHTRGLRSVAFRKEGSGLAVTFEEADEAHTFSVGLRTAAYTQISFHGEPYLVGAFGVFTSDEDETPVLKLRIVFPEIANERTVKFYFEKHGALRTRWSEQPSEEFLFRGLESLLSGLPDSKVVQTLLRGVLDTQPGPVIRAAFCPEVTGRLRQKTETE